MADELKIDHFKKLALIKSFVIDFDQQLTRRLKGGMVSRRHATDSSVPKKAKFHHVVTLQMYAASRDFFSKTYDRCIIFGCELASELSANPPYAKICEFHSSVGSEVGFGDEIAKPADLQSADKLRLAMAAKAQQFLDDHEVKKLDYTLSREHLIRTNF